MRGGHLRDRTASAVCQYSRLFGADDKEHTTQYTWPWATLDDVGPWITANRLQHYHVLFEELEKQYVGFMMQGMESADFMPDKSNWGCSRLIDPSMGATGDTMQMRFWPPTLLTDLEANKNDATSKLPPVVKIAFRATERIGDNGDDDSLVFTKRVALLFLPSWLPPGTSREAEHLRGVHADWCHGVHLVPIAILSKMHQGPFESMTVSDADGRVYMGASTVSFALTPQFEGLTRHVRCTGVASGDGAIVLADAIDDGVRFQSPGKTHTYEDSTEGWYAKQHAMYAQLEDRGVSRGADNILACGNAVCECLSATGIVNMLADPFFAGAMPIGFRCAWWIPLRIAAGARMCANWKVLGTMPPSIASAVCNERLLRLWGVGFRAQHETTTMRTIDWVVKFAFKYAEETYALATGDKSMPCNYRTHIENASLLQRSAQELVTGIFGIGLASDAPPTDGNLATPLDVASLNSHRSVGGYDPREEPLYSYVPLVRRDQRASHLLRLLNEVDIYLATAWLIPEVNNLDEVTRVNVEKSASINLHKLGKLFGADQPKPFASPLAVWKAVQTLAAFLTNGPLVDVPSSDPKWEGVQMGKTTLVAPTQSVNCSECERRVHVLHEMLHAGGEKLFTECSACRAPRCISCARQCTLEIREAQRGAVSGSGPNQWRIGKACLRCGAPPMEMRRGPGDLWEMMPRLAPCDDADARATR